MDFDWEAIASLLGDSLPQPTFACDRFGELRLLNTAAERATGWQRQEVVGRHWHELFSSPHLCNKGGRWVTDALRGMTKAASFRTSSRDDTPLLIDFEIAAIGDGESKALLLVAKRVALADSEPVHAPAHAAHIQYRLTTDHEDFGRLEFLTTESHTTYTNGTDRRCFNLIYGLDSPCPDCPVLRGSQTSWPRLAVRPHLTRSDIFEVVEASRGEGDAAQVSVRRISNEELSGLFSAKLKRIAAASSLTTRELAVLEHLMVGRGPDDIATLLSVSKRTVKFHQTNILEKLGAESRNDILRLLM